MPLKMLGFILALVILVSFVGLNWENSSDIDLWFNQKLHFEDVSIVLSFMIVFLAGMICSIPFWLDSKFRRRKKEKVKEEKKDLKILKSKKANSQEKDALVEKEQSDQTSD